MLRIKANGSYRNSKATLVFRYLVLGTVAELEAYKTAQGEFYRENDDKKPLFFSSRSAGDSADLIITQKGKVIVDMSKFDSAASLVAQYGGNLGAELAKSAVAMLLSGNTPVQNTQQPEIQEHTDDANLGES